MRNNRAFSVFLPKRFSASFRIFANIPSFKPGGQPILLLTDEQVRIYRRFTLKCSTKSNPIIFTNTIYCRNYVFELVHFALKLQPAKTIYSSSNAATRISSLFMELLERQFPIESPFQQIKFRSAIEFARQLAVHVNHLNRALKETTGKTTSELIAERLTQEAIALLKHTTWNVSEIAFTPRV